MISLARDGPIPGIKAEILSRVTRLRSRGMEKISSFFASICPKVTLISLRFFFATVMKVPESINSEEERASHEAISLNPPALSRASLEGGTVFKKMNPGMANLS